MSAAPDWEAIRRAYADHSVNVAKITARFGITKHALYKRINEEGWPRRPSLIKPKVPAPENADASDDTPSATPERPAARAKSAATKLTPIAQRRALVTRLTNAIDTKLKLLERRFQREMDGLENAKKAPTTADFERDSRAIGQLIKNLEQVTDYDHAHPHGRRISGAAAKSAAVASTALADEADRLRIELAARLQRFVDAAQGGAAGIPAGPRTGQAD